MPQRRCRQWERQKRGGWGVTFQSLLPYQHIILFIPITRHYDGIITFKFDFIIIVRLLGQLFAPLARTMCNCDCNMQSNNIGVEEKNKTKTCCSSGWWTVLRLLIDRQPRTAELQQQYKKQPVTTLQRGRGSVE